MCEPPEVTGLKLFSSILLVISYLLNLLAAHLAPGGLCHFDVYWFLIFVSGPELPLRQDEQRTNNKQTNKTFSRRDWEFDFLRILNEMGFWKLHHHHF